MIAANLNNRRKITMQDYLEDLLDDIAEDFDDDVAEDYSDI